MPVAVGYGPAYEGAVNNPIVNLLLLPVLFVQTMDTLHLDIVVESNLVNHVVQWRVRSLSSSINYTLKSKSKGHVHPIAQYSHSCPNFPPFKHFLAEHLRLLETVMGLFLEIRRGAPALIELGIQRTG